MSTKQTITATICDKRGRILAVGRNSYTKTHPQQAQFARLAGQEQKVYLHAEIAALVKLARGQKGRAFSIYIERVNSAGVTRLARPCAICELAIRTAGIKQISYTL